MPDVLRPVLPLNQFQRTLIIADTSGIHHRGYAAPGTVRQTYRVQSELNGGLKRTNPFDWEGWRMAAEAVNEHNDIVAERPKYETSRSCVVQHSS